MASITIVGCGEAFDSGLGNNSCLLHGSDVPTVLFDCGYQVPERLWTLTKLYPKLDCIYLTHIHADHSFGVVPLLTRFWEEKRKAPLRIMGPKGIQSYLTRLLDLGYPGIRTRFQFPLEFVEVKESDDLSWKGLRFRFARTEHSVLNLAVRVERASGRSRFSFGVSGDGQMTEASAWLFSDVDLLLQEVYSLKPGIPVHCDLQTLRKFADTSKARKIGVTHRSRFEKRRIDQAIEKLVRKDGRWFSASPGLKIGL